MCEFSLVQRAVVYSCLPALILSFQLQQAGAPTPVFVNVSWLRATLTSLNTCNAFTVCTVPVVPNLRDRLSCSYACPGQFYCGFTSHIIVPISVKWRGKYRGRWRKCWTDNIKEWTCLAKPELLKMAYRRKGWKGISAELSIRSPHWRPSRPRADWTEVYEEDFTSIQQMLLYHPSYPYSSY